MRYEMVNKLYGHRVICDSEKSRDHFLASCRKGKNGKIDWELGKQLDDVVAEPAFSVEQLRKMLAEAEGIEAKEVPAKRAYTKREKEVTNEG